MRSSRKRATTVWAAGLLAAVAAASPRPGIAAEPSAPAAQPSASAAAPKSPGPAVRYSPEELAELTELGETVRRFEAAAAEYRAGARALIELQYKRKRDALFNAYEESIVALEAEQRERRSRAIRAFEAFLVKHPNDEHYTPDAMFRLSELYFERSYETYFHARQQYEKAMESWDASGGAPEPVEPSFHYEPTIATMQRLITAFPDYRLVDGAYYLLGYCLGEQGEEERAVDVYHELLARRPESRFAAEVWTRIGEFYFNTNELERALEAYANVLAHEDSPFYDKAIYKLAWTHYRLADPERAPQEFQASVDTFVKLLDFNERTRAAGEERGGDLRTESIQYIAISYADEQWGGLDRLVGYLNSLGGRPYERELIAALGDVYFDQTRFRDAIRAYDIVQQRFPNHPEAPAVQDKTVTAYERSRDFDGAAAARELLSRSYSEGSPWFTANRADDAAIERANKLTAQSLYSAALFHHKQAQIHKEAKKIELATAEYQKAADAYGAYLRRFPHDRQLYELTFYLAECLYYSLQFEPAAVQYEHVRDSSADTKFLEDASYSVVLSYENAIKLAEARGELRPALPLKSSERNEAPPAPAELPPLKQELVAASDRYAELFPKNDRVPNVLYRAAELFYVYDRFDEARRRFRALIDAFPANEVAQFAVNLVIESYLCEKDYAAVESFASEALGRPVAALGELRGELVKFKTGAMFKLSEQLAEKGEHEKAAEQYLKMLAESPDSQFADSALNNAAVAYEKVKRYDSASRLYTRLVNEQPKSPLAALALFRVGVNAERFFDFDKAIEAYERLVSSYPKSEQRADAIYNGALALENIQRYERAAREYLRYCELFKSRDDAPQVCFRAGLVYEKMSEPRRVIAVYRDFVRAFRKNAAHADRVIEAHLKIAQAYEKLDDEKRARAAYEEAMKGFRANADSRSAPFAAEANFRLVEREFGKFRALAITGNSKEQKKALTRKAELLKSVEEKYRAILVYKQIDWTLAALFRIGQLYQTFAESLALAPCPPDVRRAGRGMGATAGEVCEEYRVLLEEKASGIEDKAVAAYETTITKARELQVVNDWTKQTLVALNQLRVKSWPLQKTAKVFVDPVVLRAPGPVDGHGELLAPRVQP